MSPLWLQKKQNSIVANMQKKLLFSFLIEPSIRILHPWSTMLDVEAFYGSESLPFEFTKIERIFH